MFRKIFFEVTLCVTLSFSHGSASALSCQLSHRVFTSLPHPSRLWFSSIDTEGNRLLSRRVMNQLLPLTLYYYSPYISRLQMKRQAEKGDREGERSPEVSFNRVVGHLKKSPSAIFKDTERCFAPEWQKKSEGFHEIKPKKSNGSKNFNKMQ